MPGGFDNKVNAIPDCDDLRTSGAANLLNDLTPG